MPHVYDSGALRPQRSALRDAVIARLRLLTLPGLYLQAVRPLPLRVVGDELGQAEIGSALNGAHPAILVALGRGEAGPAGMGANHSRLEIEVAVYVVSGHRRGIVEGRLAGDVRTSDVTKDPGVETMLEHVEELLTGWDPEVTGVSEMRLQGEAEIFTGEDLTIWEILFSVRADRTALRHPLVTQLLTEIAAGHHVDGADPANPVASTLTTVEAP